jgi:hypothetical protein
VIADVLFQTSDDRAANTDTSTVIPEDERRDQKKRVTDMNNKQQTMGTNASRKED